MISGGKEIDGGGVPFHVFDRKVLAEGDLNGDGITGDKLEEVECISTLFGGSAGREECQDGGTYSRLDLPSAAYRKITGINLQESMTYFFGGESVIHAGNSQGVVFKIGDTIEFNDPITGAPIKDKVAEFIFAKNKNSTTMATLVRVFGHYEPLSIEALRFF